MKHTYDIIIFGGGIAGLFIANRLRNAGYNLILIERDKLGGAQTLASQGMIHGGQKYATARVLSGHVPEMEKMPPRWKACFDGKGEVDLTGVEFSSPNQIMFPAASVLSKATLRTAMETSNTPMTELQDQEIPDVLTRRPVYRMQEQVLDTKSLVAALAKNLAGRIVSGELEKLSPDGCAVVSGIALKAEAIIFAAGIGNEAALKLLGVTGEHTQRRPLRQVMVKPLAQSIYGHGTSDGIKPRVTITSHALNQNEYVWYLGGGVAEKGAKLSELEAIKFAKQEMADIFPNIDWGQKEWASHSVDRAESLDAQGWLPTGTCIQQFAKNLLVWPAKMTLVPDLADKVFSWLQKSANAPTRETAPPPLPAPEVGKYPWETVLWKQL